MADPPKSLAETLGELVRYSNADLGTSIKSGQGAYFQHATEVPKKWPRRIGEQVHRVTGASPLNPLQVEKVERFESAGEAALRTLRPDVQPLIDNVDIEGLQAWGVKNNLLTPAELAFVKEDGSWWSVADILGGKLARRAGHDAIMAQLPAGTHREYVALHESALSQAIKKSQAIGDHSPTTMTNTLLAGGPTTMTNPLPGYQPLTMTNTPLNHSLAAMITQHLASQPRPLVNTPLAGTPLTMGRR